LNQNALLEKVLQNALLEKVLQNALLEKVLQKTTQRHNKITVILL